MTERLLRGWVLAVLVPTLAFFAPVRTHAQSNMEVFGQNRVQYRDFDWKYFDTRHFRVYHYDKAGRQLGRYVAEEAEEDITLIEKKLGGKFPKRFNIILYNSYDEFRQSNVGLKDETPTIGNARPGSLRIVDDKLVVYYTGEHRDLRHQIRSGMALVVMGRMIFGENFKKMVKNAVLLNLPQWVTEGYIAYLVDGWDARANSEWKGLLEANPNAGFFKLAEQHPELAGKAFWKFVSNQFGPNATKNLLYSMQQKTDLNKAMKEKGNLNMKITRAYDSCIKFYKKAYALDSAAQEKPDSTNGIRALKVPHDNSVITNVRVSPSGTEIGYVVWKNGIYTVCTQRTTGEQAVTTLVTGGEKDLTEPRDPSYPFLAWSGTGDKLAILYQKKRKTLLRIYNSKKGRIENYVIPPNRFDRVLSVGFMEDNNDLVLSAIKKSQTDLYRFTIKGSKITNITDDVWDDLSPQFISGGSRTGILFLSNRPKPNLNVPQGVNELPTGPLNVFFYNTKSGRPELLQCSYVTKGHVSQPIQYGNDNFAFLLDSSGINNKYVVMFTRTAANMDSAFSVPVTNYSTSILVHQYSLPTGDVADVIQQGDKYMVYFHGLQMPGEDMQGKKLRNAVLSYERPDVKVVGEEIKPAAANKGDELIEPDAPQRPSVVKGGTAFQSEFTDTVQVAPRKRAKVKLSSTGAPVVADSSMLTEMTDSAYLKMSPAKYRLSFKPDFLSLRLDNSTIFSQYQSIPSMGAVFQEPQPSELTSISLNDVLENYRVSGGVQIPLSFDPSSTACFLKYQNFRHRLDWGLSYIRKQDNISGTVYVYSGGGLTELQEPVRSVSNAVQVDFSYPIDRRRSWRARTVLRQDKSTQKIADAITREYDLFNAENLTSLSRVEYVFDNTLAKGTNIQIGHRYKFYTELMYGLNHGNKSCYNIGMDYRNYEPLYKNFVLATRFAYTHSEGNNRVLYQLGGVDNALLQRKDTRAGYGATDQYGFVAMATSMRGYLGGVREGNSFGVLSNELRLPLVTTFANRPIHSALLKNLMLVGFLDVGAAWRGWMPDAESLAPAPYTFPDPKNPTFPPTNMSLTVTPLNASKVLVGYGPGLRTSLLGYYIRTDLAWNIEGTRKPVFYLALGTDF